MGLQSFQLFMANNYYDDKNDKKATKFFYGVGGTSWIPPISQQVQVYNAQLEGRRCGAQQGAEEVSGSSATLRHMSLVAIPGVSQQVSEILRTFQNFRARPELDLAIQEHSQVLIFRDFAIRSTTG